MSPLQDRIAQFRKMANDDPDNELGHYRLGQLLMEDKQYGEAIRSFRRTLELSPQFSKVYHLLALALAQEGQRDEAVRVLREGFDVADERGDNMPRDEMAKMLAQLGKPVPAAKKAAAAGDGFHCNRPGCMAGRHARKLPKPPMNDAVGQRIFETVCADCWTDWLRTIAGIRGDRYDFKIDSNIAENSGGPHTLKYGVTTNHVLGLELVLPGGEVVQLGGGCEERCGYDLVGAVVVARADQAVLGLGVDTLGIGRHLGPIEQLEESRLDLGRRRIARLPLLGEESGG